MAKIDKEYHKLINVILSDGFIYEDPNRKGINRIQIPSYTFKHSFEDGFPAITTKKLYWKGVVGELLWFLKGDTNIKYLLENNISIWNKDAYNHFLKGNPELTKCTGPEDCKNIPFDVENEMHLKLFLGETLQGTSGTGDLGKVYGAQWRNWRAYYSLGTYENKNNYSEDEHWSETEVDQIYNLIKGLKENPMSTQHIVTAWNPAELDDMALPPCHWSFEILVEPMSAIDRVSLLGRPLETFTRDAFEQHKLCDEYNVPQYRFTLKWHQRSVDTFLGLPFNIASYALLAQIIGKMTNMVPKGIEGDLSNVHLYELHLDAVSTQLNRSIDEHSISNLLMLDEFHYMTATDLVGNLSADEIINNLRIDMFTLGEYTSYPAIKAQMLAYKK